MSENNTTNPPPAPEVLPSDAVQRVSRLGLFLPVAFLVVLLVGWSAFWFVARARVHDAITIWLAQEAEQQRQWSCPDRTVAGFPFRFEVRCTDLRFSGTTPAGTVTGTLAHFLAVAQVYKPNHVVVEAQGPLVADQEGGERITMDWQSFDASAIFSGNRLDRFAIVVTQPSIVAGLNGDRTPVMQAKAWEWHLRIDPERPSDDHVYDVAFTLSDAQLPALDVALGTQDAATIAFKGAITEAAPFTAKAPSVEFERWRLAGGVFEIDELSLTKGPQRLQARGQLSIDDFRRPQGRIEASVTGLEDLLTRFGLGGRSNAIANGLAILGGRNAQAENAIPGLTPLPPITIRDGQVFVGPFGVSRVAPLY
ncbi:DUF2125 domain-containing protein [Pseudochelatococcus sp. G4_1912]|uniref:DUF2125 domain-containing protein n=1 Tax=Pseudochelatococcus sp. G4_1912 TaxID=3114288 RepID=UPI0039C66BA2